MRQYFVNVLLLLVLLSLNLAQCMADEKTSIFSFKVHKDFPEYKAVVSWAEHMGSYEPRSLSIYRADKESALQTIDALESDYSFAKEDEGPSRSFLEAVNYNFDGFMDLRMLVTSGTGGSTYLVWLYNPIADRFEQGLSELSSLEIDEESMELVKYSTDKIWSSETRFRWEQGQLRKVKQIDQAFFDRSIDSDEMQRIVISFDNNFGIDLLERLKASGPEAQKLFGAKDVGVRLVRIIANNREENRSLELYSSSDWGKYERTLVVLK